MRIDEVLKQGDLVHETSYEYLFHICDSHGFAYAVQENALKAFRHPYVSTTYDPDNNAIIGIDHAAFKFVLDGPALVHQYGAREMDFHTLEVGNNRSRLKSLKERELGIMTKEIAPLDQYLKGVVLMFRPYTQKAMQDLLYDHPSYKLFLDMPKSEAIRGIDALFRLKERGLPIWNLEMGREVSSKEWVFLKAIHAVHKRGGDFNAGMRSIAAKFPLEDHWGKDLTRRTVVRTQQAQILTKLLNDYYVGRRVQDVKPAAVKGLLIKAMNILNLNPNIQTVVVQSAEEAGLFHPVMQAVGWTSIFRDLMYGDVDEALRDIKFQGKNLAPHIEWHDRSDTYRTSTHSGTMMA